MAVRRYVVVPAVQELEWVGGQVTKQERRAAKQAAADEQFEAILERAKEIARLNQEERQVKWKRPEAMPKKAFKVACAIRVLREGGTAWWAIAQSLGLPGAGNSATTGKSGASYARRLYSQAFGDLPAVRASSKQAATTLARQAGAFFPEDVLDEVVESTCMGSKVIWQVRIGEGDNAIVKEDDAVCSPNRVVVIDTPRGRALRFNSVIRSDDNALAWHRGPERTVLVHRIMQVTAGIPGGAQVI